MTIPNDRTSLNTAGVAIALLVVLAGCSTGSRDDAAQGTASPGSTASPGGGPSGPSSPPPPGTKVVLAEMISIHTCPYCAQASGELPQVVANNNGQFTYLCYFSDASFTSPEQGFRAGMYGASGVPHLQFDGTTPVVGGGQSAAYQNAIDAALALPLEVSLAPEYTESGNTLTISGTLENLAGRTLSNCDLYVAVTEDGRFTYTSGQPADHVVVAWGTPQSITNVAPGGTLTINATVDVSAVSDRAQMKVTVFVQDLSNNAVLNAAEALKR